MPESTRANNGLWWALAAIVVVAIVAWFLIGATGGGIPGIPNTGTDTGSNTNTTGNTSGSAY